MLARCAALGAIALSTLSTQSVDAEPSLECGLEDPAIAAALAPVAPKPSELLRQSTSSAELPPIVRSTGYAIGASSIGALTGKTVYLSPGHGFTYIPNASGWRTQRGNTHDLIEDLISVETVSVYLARMLRAMGATVVAVRELDFRSDTVIVDDGDPAFSIRETPQVRELGTGFGHLPVPITGNENPFDSGAHKVFDTDSEGNYGVRWLLDVEVSGDYDLYVGYIAAPDRASDAHYVVNHPAGETHFRVDQRRHGGTWIFLGRFHFEAGSDPARASVELRSGSETPGTTLSADVVRIGGGMGPFDRGGGVSNRPMFEHSARYYTQWAGAPESVYDYGEVDRNNDVGSRPRFAAWDHEEGEDAVYVAWHTNAPNPGRGTSSYAYANIASGSVENFAGVPGSLELMDAIHQQLVGDIRRDWDSEWQDRGQRTAFFGEVNPDHNPEMPATLIEVGFHDTAADADALRDPRFRKIAAKAIARGIATYFATRDGLDLVLPPNAPTSLTMTSSSEGAAIAWEPSPGADHYIVYTSPNGRSFAEGVVVSDPEIVIDVDSDSDEPLIYARVAAANSAGESLPSPLIGARLPAGDRASVLVVSGFDRLDGSMLIPTDLSEYGVGTVERGFVDRINDRSHLARYGTAIASYGAAFDSADRSAVERNAIRLSDYDVVMWFAGESSEEGEPLGAATRVLLTDFLDAGGKLLISGSELAWTYDNVLADEHSTFFQSTFDVRYVADDAETYEVIASDAMFADLGALRFDDQNEGGYNANFPDVVEPIGGRSVFEYATGGTAAAYSEDAGVIYFGFPFETITGIETRANVMQQVLTTFNVEPEVDLPPGTSRDPDGGCGCSGSGSGTGLGGSGGWLLLALALLWLAESRTRWLKRTPTQTRIRKRTTPTTPKAPTTR